MNLELDYRLLNQVNGKMASAVMEYLKDYFVSEPIFHPFPTRKPSPKRRNRRKDNINLVREIFHKSIKPYRNIAIHVKNKVDSEAAAAAARDGYVLVDIAALAEAEITKMIIKDINAGMAPLTVGAKYDIPPGELVRRLAKYAHEQGVRSGDIVSS